MLFVYVIGWLAGSYLLIVLVMYLAQTRLLFPTYLASFAETELPSSAQRLRITAGDGTHLAGVVFSPTREPRSEEVLLVGFGGNVESMALSLHRQFPTMRAAGFHYRGYRPSGGRPGAKGVLADALETFDALQAQLPASRTIAIGFSIGTPVAAYLAQHRALDGLILVTPFDSLVELARDHFRWLPVRALLRHRMSTLDFISGVSTPTAMIAAGRDSVVPARRTEPLRRVIPNLVFDRVIPEAEHNDLYELSAFWDALGEAVQTVLRNGAHARFTQKRPG
jgi:pimeloyl-ACP methyl ester carboxylesterase